MKNGLKLALAFGFGVALLQVTAAAQDKPASTNAATNAPKLSPEEQKQNMSYAIGMNIGNNIKRGGVELDVDVMTGAMKDVHGGQHVEADGPAGAGSHESLPDGIPRQAGGRCGSRSAEKNKKEGEAFLAENKKKPGVKTHTVKLPGWDHGRNAIQGHHRRHGRHPEEQRHRGGQLPRHADQRQGVRQLGQAGGQPAKFPVNRVVRGWTEALQMMKAGSKWELYLPASLAYGDGGSGPNIEPGSTLIFEMELTGIEAPPPAAAPAAPLTSDIIRVPSAEELKKGAKIEVIKPEDLEKIHERRGPEAATERRSSQGFKRPAPLRCPSPPGQSARPCASARG